MPVVAKMPTWLDRALPGMPTVKSTTVSPLRSRADRQVAHAAGQEGEVLRLGATTRENWVGRLLGLRNSVRGPPGADGRGQVAEAAAAGHPVGPPGLLVQRMGARVAPLVVGQQRARHPLGPPRLPVLGAVGDVHHPEQVPPTGRLVHPDQQLAEEEVLVRSGPERPLQHVLAEQPVPVHASVMSRSIRRWRSAKARSRTSSGTPARSKPSSSWDQMSSRSQPGQAASRSATLSGYG